MILFDGIIYNIQNSGGVSVVFKEIISRLPQSSYLLLGGNKVNPLNIEDDNYIHKRPRFLERLRRVKYGNHFDLFHSTYYRLPAVKSSKIVTTAHDYTYEYFSSGIRKSTRSYIMNKAFSESDKIICVSENTRQDLINFSGSSYEDRAVVIHNGVSDDYCIIPEIVVKPQIIFIGARSGYKNFKSLVYALSNMSDLTLICVGGGSFNSDEISLMERYIKNRYRHTGFLTNVRLNIEYNRSLCLVYPSLYEGFGIPILESMRAGCPVVAVNCSSIPEVAGDAAILMSKGDPDEIREAITKIMVSGMRKTLIDKGLTQSQKFSWDKTFAKTLDVYEDLLGYSITSL
jgi:mannosyltransferase